MSYSWKIRHAVAIRIFFAVAIVLFPLGSSLSAQTDDPDALYHDRANRASAMRAAQLWEARAGTDYEAARKLHGTVKLRKIQLPNPQDMGIDPRCKIDML